MPDELKPIIKKFLRYSFNDIDYNYDSLTEHEQSFATREEFEKLVAWVKEG